MTLTGNAGEGNLSGASQTSDAAPHPSQMKEGSYYTLPNPIKRKNFMYWYNTGDGNIYNIGDKVKIWHGTYFKAIYK